MSEEKRIETIFNCAVFLSKQSNFPNISFLGNLELCKNHYDKFYNQERYHEKFQSPK